MLEQYAKLIKLRRRVFEEVARLGYSDESIRKKIDELPYEIVKQSFGRSSLFLERAIVGERIRLALGLPLRNADEYGLTSDGINKAIVTERYYQPPLVNIIDFACNACPKDSFFVTSSCEGCLANPCANVCPKQAISLKNGKSFIDQDLCIKCGRCQKVCPYNAIIHRKRPCEAVCGMNAIISDENGKAKIDYSRCVSCGMCMVNCPFGAIADKSQIFQIIQAIKSDTDVYAIVAPAFIGQFGPKVNLKTLDDAFSKLGFKGVFEVSIGADLCTIEEAKDFLENVPNKLKFMATSCCPAWSKMAKMEFPEYKENISMALTPMVYTARLIKKKYPNSKIVFVGPCSAKKLEASRAEVRSDVDFVLTFEEIYGMFMAKDVDFTKLKEAPLKNETSADGRGFAIMGGVAQAVVHSAKVLAPEREVNVFAAQGLNDCREMLKDAVAGKYDGYLLEGMACPSGCISGPGTLSTPTKAKNLIALSQKETPLKASIETNYKNMLDKLD